MSDRKANLSKQYGCDPDTARRSDPVYSTPSFGLHIEKHDDEKKKHHHRACINQHLYDSHETGVKRYKQRSQPKKGDDQAEGARNGITIKDNSGAEDDHQQRKDP